MKKILYGNETGKEYTYEEAKFEYEELKNNSHEFDEYDDFDDFVKDFYSENQ